MKARDTSLDCLLIQEINFLKRFECFEKIKARFRSLFSTISSVITASTGAVISTATRTFAHDGHGSVMALFNASAAFAQVYMYSAMASY